MQIQMIKTFLLLAKSGSISKCSQKLNISEQGLSRQLRVMETELKTKLFNRTHRGIKLTAAGQAVIPSFEKVVQHYDQGLDQLTRLKDKPGPTTLTVYVCPGIKQALGLQFFYRFQTQYPQIKLKPIFVEDDASEQALINGQADAAFLDWPHHRAAFHCHLVVKSRLMAVMRADNPLAKNQQLSMKQLAGVQVYFPNESDYMSQRFRKHWPHFYAAVRHPFSSNDYDTFYQLPQQLGGVALTFKFLCKHVDQYHLVALPVKESSYVELFYCLRKSTVPSPALQLFSQYVIDHVHLIEN